MSENLILGISGLAGTGKDSVCDVLVNNFGYVKIALADPMKRFCMEIFNWSPEILWGPSELRSQPDTRYPVPHDDGTVEYLTSRKALQELGTEWARSCYQDVWIDYAMRIAEKLNTSRRRYYTDDIYDHFFRAYYPDEGISKEYSETGRKGVVISDCRFKNEILAIQKNGGKVIRIKRPGYEKPRWNHRSETEQMTIPDNQFDYVLENDGTLEDLVVKAGHMLEKLV